MNKLQVGYAQVNINAPLGIGVNGYYVPRFAKGYLDDMYASALALQCKEEKVLMITVDVVGLGKVLSETYRQAVANATGIKFENIFLSCSHTHTGPFVEVGFGFAVDKEQVQWYVDFLRRRIVDVAQVAMNDIKPAKMGFITGYAPERVAYIRRYKMKDGSIMTCPPVGDPNIDHPLGVLDQRVHVLRFDQENGETIVLMNYGLHADTIGGEYLSSDWIGWVRDTLYKALDGVKCMCVVGCQGDVGSTNVFPKGGDMNDTEISFDNEMKSPGMARFVGRALAGTVLQVFDKVEYIDVEDLAILHKDVKVGANKGTPEQLPLARKYKELHDAGRDDEIPFEAMELTTVIAEANRICRMETAPDFFDIHVTGLKIGSVAFVGFGGEPFTDIGVQVKDTPGWSMIMTCCIVNGYAGYFPTKEAYDEGGYEVRGSSYQSNVAELLVTAGKEILKTLSEK